jgi:hypothetical protein
MTLLHCLSLPLAALVVGGCVPVNGGGDGGGCLEIACGPSYEVKFTRNLWPTATYRIEVVSDGSASSCDVVIPMSCDRGPRCQGNPTWLPGLVGCALDPGQQSIDGITFAQSTPASVTVRVFQSDRLLATQIFMPHYQTTPPRPGCSLSCTQAPTDRLTLPP